MKPAMFDATALHTLGLHLQLASRRLGWLLPLAAALCAIGACCWLWWLPSLQAGAVAQRRALAQAEHALRAAPGTQAVALSPNEQNFTAYRNMLGERHYAEQQVRTLFAIAAKSGLNLAQAEYKSTYDKGSNTYTYRIVLPVQGPYSAIRAFCQQVLLAIPFASLDEIGFKREAIADKALEARVRFTLYLADPMADGAVVALASRE